MRNRLFTALAHLCIIIGVAGIFIPLLPTTPFLLLALILLTKSSPKLAQRLIGNKYLGVYIRSYANGERLPARDKAKIIAILITTITLSIVYATDNLYMRIGLVIIAIAVSAHIIMLRPKRNNSPKS